MPSRPRALVTGASSGIGRALAQRLAKGGYDLVLCGRDAAQLRAAQRACQDLGAKSDIVLADLSLPGAVARVYESLDHRSLEVLVNNAGFTVHGDFSETDLKDEIAMIAVHVGAVLELTKLVLPGMLERGRGRILNVGSVYSFAPVPHQAVYGASKAFLLSFSDSLWAELRGSGVSVTALCPGVTRTEFRARAGVSTKRMSGMSAEEVAECGYRGMMAGCRLVVPGLLNKLFVFVARRIPSGAIPALTGVISRFRGLGPAKKRL